MSNFKSQQKPVFDLSWMGKGYSQYRPRDPRSAALGLLDDYSKVKLSTDWLKGKSQIAATLRRERILSDTASTPLNADHWVDIVDNMEKFPEEWKKDGRCITFDGDIFIFHDGRQHPDGRLFRGKSFVLGLSWQDNKQQMVRVFLEGYANHPSAVLASG